MDLSPYATVVSSPINSDNRSSLNRGLGHEVAEAIVSLGAQIGEAVAKRNLARPVNILFVGPPAVLKTTFIGEIQAILEQLNIRTGYVDEATFLRGQPFTLSEFRKLNPDKEVILIEAVLLRPPEWEFIDLFIRLQGSLAVRQARIISTSGSLEYAQLIALLKS